MYVTMRIIISSFPRFLAVYPKISLLVLKESRVEKINKLSKLVNAFMGRLLLYFVLC